MKEIGVNTLVGLIAHNEEAQRFYRSLPNAKIQDEGIWIDLQIEKFNLYKYAYIKMYCLCHIDIGMLSFL